MYPVGTLVRFNDRALTARAADLICGSAFKGLLSVRARDARPQRRAQELIASAQHFRARGRIIELVI